MKTKNEITNLFNDNINLVHYVIHKKFQSYKTKIPNHDYDDIVQIGNIGLWKACLTYDENRSIKFCTYAIKVISNEILRVIRKYKKVQNYETVSIDSLVEIKNGEEVEFHNLLESNEYKTISLIELKNYINDKYKNSKKRRIEIINSYIFEDITEEEIGKRYGYSQPQISRIIKKFKNDIKTDFEGGLF